MVETAITLIVLNATGMAYLVFRSFGTGYGTKKGGNAADREDLPAANLCISMIIFRLADQATTIELIFLLRDVRKSDHPICATVTSAAERQ
ncbi:hypothetical protein [Variovorax sp. PAMC26660]|uniref:hypothetical protein n=1 Tax=Variovorax sp. PAMC26660 TaxID=2762322 RepID=UPI00164EB017|nr:hypothetical protein [Variovorax sp. PAMC26660]QNK65824.1 hypothetical protein H7F35_21745 [Variovorax sp. PAMC26660]